MLYVDLPPLIIDNYSNIIYMNITVCTYLQLRFSCVTRLSCISFEVGCVHWWRFTGWSKMHPPKLQNTTRRIASAIRLDPHGATRKGGRCTIAGLGRHDAEILKYIEKRCQVSKKWARLNWGLSCWLVWMLSIHIGMSKIHNSWRESQRVTCCYGFMRIVVLPVVEIAACWCLKFDRKSFRMFPPNEST